MADVLPVSWRRNLRGEVSEPADSGCKCLDKQEGPEGTSGATSGKRPKTCGSCRAFRTSIHGGSDYVILSGPLGLFDLDARRSSIRPQGLGP